MLLNPAHWAFKSASHLASASGPQNISHVRLRSHNTLKVEEMRRKKKKKKGEVSFKSKQEPGLGDI